MIAAAAQPALPFDPKDFGHWQELAKPVRLLTYGGSGPQGLWFVQCIKPWRLSIKRALRRELRT